MSLRSESGEAHAQRTCHQHVALRFTFEFMLRQFFEAAVLAVEDHRPDPLTAGRLNFCYVRR